MSKDRPEVGDVWQYPNGIKMVIVKETMSIDIFREPKEIISFTVVEDDGEPNIHEEIVFLGNFTYLGKSKARIEDLFKTENEE